MSKPETVLSQWEGTFAVLESNRRLSSSLLQESAHTSKLTRWVVGLTIAMAVLTVLLAAFGSVDPVKNWRTVDDAMRTGVYAPAERQQPEISPGTGQKGAYSAFTRSITSALISTSLTSAIV